MKGKGVFAILVLFCVTAGANDALWQYHQRQFHQRLDARDFYGAKQELARLRNLDAETYRQKGFAATEAWIALQQGYWDSAYRHNRSVARWNGDTALEMARCLEQMGRYREALAHVDLPDIRFSGENRWEVYSLQARCMLALGKDDEAMALYETLAKSKAPPFYRIPALQALIEVYYQTGRFRKARTMAERIQKNSPGSDAALVSVILQEQYESEKYLGNSATWQRFAKVCYNNRNYERSDKYFGLLEQHATGVDAQRAAYFKALTHLKKGRSDEARTAFQEVMQRLEGSRFEGPASFQYARSLFMSGHDQETIDFVARYQREGNDPKWRAECFRLSILAMRRMGDESGLRELGYRFEKQGAPGWLKRFYHRNGVALELYNGRPDEAIEHLENYRRYRMKSHERQEAKLWEGLIYWEQGGYENAVEKWLEIVTADPNHFFGLVARSLITESGAFTNLWQKERAVVWESLETQPMDVLRRLYYLAPDQASRDHLATYLEAGMPDTQWLKRGPHASFGDEALTLAEIGRYDRAARILKHNRKHKPEYHYLEASWYMKAGMLHDSIRHAEILANSWPRWVPYELMPPEIQHLVFPEGFAQIVHEKAGDYKVDPYLLLAIIREESRFNTRAKSWASARGLMQFIPSTAEETARQVKGLENFDLPMLYDPGTAIALGAKYVDNLMRSFDGESLYTIAAYNAGEGAVRRWSGMDGDHDPLRFVWDVTYDETKYYCQKVLRAYHHYSRVYRHDVEPDIIKAPRLENPRASGIDAIALPH